MDWILLSFITLHACTYANSMNPRILELNDRFLDWKKDGLWLIMFYAPWCAHCKRMEPIWSHIQQTLHNTAIKVGRMDCEAHKSVCRQLRVQSFPTVTFFKGDDMQFEYNGDRTTEEIVHFALRLSSPPVRQLKDDEMIHRLKKENIIFFSFLGEPSGILWETYNDVAKKFQPHSYFYHATAQFSDKHFKELDTPSVIVHKENNLYYFNDNERNDDLNASLTRWVNEERFPTFVKVTRLNINSLMETNKYLVLAVVEESKIQEIPQHMNEFKNMIESVIKKYRDRFHKSFQFGWIGSPDLANSIAIMKVPLPYLLVLNTTTNHHHIPDDEPHRLTPDAIILFLESILNQTAKTYGGNNIFINLYRVYFESLVALTEMWKGNPVLTTVLFGLPSGFLILICYTIHCADILDADEDDADDDSGHEKKE